MVLIEEAKELLNNKIFLFTTIVVEIAGIIEYRDGVSIHYLTFLFTHITLSA